MTQMMRVYRLADAHGTGPYRRRIGDDTLKQMEMENAHCNRGTHPAETVDFNRLHQPSERFGFDDMRKLMAWFGPYLGHLLEIGYKIEIYEVPAQYVLSGKSGKQIMFPIRVARRVAAKRKRLA